MLAVIQAISSLPAYKTNTIVFIRGLRCCFYIQYMTKTSLVMVQPGTSPVSGATWCACGVMLMCPRIVFHH